MPVDKKKQLARQDVWKKANTDRIQLNIPKGLKAEWQAKAAAEGKSLTQWLIDKTK